MLTSQHEPSTSCFFFFQFSTQRPSDFELSYGFHAYQFHPRGPPPLLLPPPHHHPPTDRPTFSAPFNVQSYDRMVLAVFENRRISERVKAYKLNNLYKCGPIKVTPVTSLLGVGVRNLTDKDLSKWFLQSTRAIIPVVPDRSSRLPL